MSKASTPGTTGSTLRGVMILGTTTVLMVGTPGCIADPPVAFDSPSPQRRMEAIARASEAEDQESLVSLVEKLGSTDPAERMLAIRALERREGTTLGYDHAAPQWERIEAIQRWRERLGIGLSDGDGDDSVKDPMSKGDQEGETLAGAANGTDTFDSVRSP